MKKREKKALELVDKGKQLQFDNISNNVPVPKEKKDFKKFMGKKPPTYWRCKNNHVFMVKQRLHPDREKDLNCPECSARMVNAVNEGTYMYYLNKHGRGDKKSYIKRFGEKGN